jgi:succinate dehydrogenase / fumarate reductase, flavoprotein subunit
VQAPVSATGTAGHRIVRAGRPRATGLLVGAGAMPGCDVLVLGAGLAGQRAALAAAQAGASVAVVSKVHPVRSHSVAAAGGINAAVDDDDCWEQHAADTVKGSDYLADQDAVEVLCREAPEEIRRLERQGVAFHRNASGRLDTRPFGAASHDRTCYVADITGQAILHVLYEQMLRLDAAIDRYEEWFVSTLLTDDDGACTGCVARDVRTGRLERFAAKSVILATGGAGQCYKPTTNAVIARATGSRSPTAPARS